MSSISEYILGFYDGPHATPKEASEGPIFLGIKNVTPDGRLDFSEIRHVSDNEFPRWTKRVTPQKDDVVFTYEATLHRYAIIPEGFHGCLGRRMALMRPDTTKVFPQFLHYYCLSSAWRKEAEASVISGATVDRIPLTKVPGFHVDFPEINIQKRIATILSAYDDLIENNRRRIALLEEAARLLYREWFVHFRFPGHEHVKIVDGVPEGWRFIKVQDAVKRHPPGKLYAQKNALNEGKVPILDQGQSGLIGFHNEEPSFLASTDDPVIVFANHTCYQRLIHYPFSAIQNVLPFKPGAEVPDEIYWLHHATEGLIKLNAYKGHWPEFSAKEFIVPSDDLAMEFSNIVRPQHLQIYKLNEQNIHLAMARDLLLPRLMDGRLEV